MGIENHIDPASIRERLDGSIQQLAGQISCELISPSTDEHGKPLAGFLDKRVKPSVIFENPSDAPESITLRDVVCMATCAIAKSRIAENAEGTRRVDMSGCNKEEIRALRFVWKLIGEEKIPGLIVFVPNPEKNALNNSIIPLFVPVRAGATENGNHSPYPFGFGSLAPIEPVSPRERKPRYIQYYDTFVPAGQSIEHILLKVDAMRRQQAMNILPTLGGVVVMYPFSRFDVNRRSRLAYLASSAELERAFPLAGNFVSAYCHGQIPRPMQDEILNAAAIRAQDQQESFDVNLDMYQRAWEQEQWEKDHRDEWGRPIHDAFGSGDVVRKIADSDEEFVFTSSEVPDFDQCNEFYGGSLEDGDVITVAGQQFEVVGRRLRRLDSDY